MSSSKKPKANDVIVIDSYQPDYKRKCINCEQTPVVTAVKNGKVVYQGDMCGPCTWGESETIDPATWNS